MIGLNSRERELSFVHETLPTRVVFGVGAADGLRDEVERLRARRVLVITGGPIGAELVEPLGELMCGHIDTVRVHVPVEDVDAAEAMCARMGADLSVCVGGGSTIGLGKALAHRRGQPLIAVPTTYSGSEMTPIYGITSGDDKRTARDPVVLPRTVVYDPCLTTGLPASVTATSGMNAIAHCVEALYSESWNPVIALMAAEGVRALTAGLPAAVADPGDVAARGECLMGSYLAGVALGSSSMGLHHRLCHVLGGMSRAEHGDLNAVALPHVMAFNAPAAGDAMAMVERAMGVDDAATGMYDFARELGAPKSLTEIGVAASGLDTVAAAIADKPVANPRPYSTEEIRILLQTMYGGVRPERRDA